MIHFSTIDPSKLNPNFFSSKKLSAQKIQISDNLNFFCELFPHPKPHEHNGLSFEINELIYAIQKSLRRIDQSNQIEKAKQYVQKALCQNKDASDAMVELGSLLYYLDQNIALPETSSLFHHRISEIEIKLKHIAQARTKHNDLNSQIPSGKIHYLLDEIVSMILTKDQFLNRGGVLACKLILTNPCSQIPIYLQPDHCEQIVQILDEILANPALDTLLKKRIKIHPSLKEFISLDLKLLPDAPLTSYEAMRVSLLSLFADIRQRCNSNCYAISAVKFAQRHPYKMISTTLEWLETGSFKIKDFCFPIEPLLNKRLLWRKELSFKASFEKIIYLYPFQQLLKIFQIDSISIPKHEELISLEKTIKLFFEKLGKHKWTYAKKFILSYNSNCLIEMHLTIVEFGTINLEYDESLPYFKPVAKLLSFSDFKQEFIKKCINSLTIRGLSNQNCFSCSKKCLESLKIKLQEQLWFENFHETNALLVGEQVIRTNSQPIWFSGNITQLVEVIKENMRLCRILDGVYTPIAKFSDLTAIIQEVFRTIRLTPPKCQTLQQAEKNLKTQLFERRIFALISKNFGGKIFSEGELRKDDLLLFPQQGGDANHCLKMVYSLNLTPFKISVKGTTPYVFTIQLLEQFKKMDAALFKKYPTCIVETSEHYWSLSFKSLQLALEHKVDFIQFMQSSFFERSRAILGSTLPDAIRESILRKAAQLVVHPLNSQDNEILNKSTYLDLKNFIVSKTPAKDLNTIKAIINEEFSKFILNEEDIKIVLESLQIRIKPETLRMISRFISESPILPFRAALRLRAALICEKIALIDPYKLELLLCDQKKFPTTLILGDLNWVDLLREDPFHTLLVVRICWFDGILSFFKRTADREVFESSSAYQELTLHLPPLLELQKKSHI